MRDAAGRSSHNLFGIKAGANWRGRTVEVVTTEYENGVARKVIEKFRAYDSYADAFRDWAGLMMSNPRYAQVLRAGRDAEGFARGLQQAGYATDPQYGAKLARAIAATAQLRNKG
jgi:flagellar protein FlgJ